MGGTVGSVWLLTLVVVGVETTISLAVADIRMILRLRNSIVIGCRLSTLELAVIRNGNKASVSINVEWLPSIVTRLLLARSPKLGTTNALIELNDIAPSSPEGILMTQLSTLPNNHGVR